MAKRTPQERFAAEQAKQAKSMAGASTTAKMNATKATKPGEIKISTPNGYIPVSQWDFGYGKGVTSPTAPATTGTAAAAAHSNPGIEGIYNNALTGNDTAYNNTISGIQYGEGSLVNDYFGWKPEQAAGFYKDGFLDYDSVMNAGVDPSNPFSKMALLSRSYQQGQAATKNGYAAGGHIFSGGYGRAKDSLSFENNRQKNDLYNAFNNSANSFKTNRLGAADTRTTNNGIADSNRISTYLGS